MMNVIKSQQQERQTNTRPGMLTISQSEAIQYMQALKDIVSDFEEMKQFSESLIKDKNKELDEFRKFTITKFNTLVESTEELAKKIKNASSYEEYLEEKINSANLTKELNLVQIQLERQRSEVTVFIKSIEDIIKKDLTLAIDKVKEIESADTMIKTGIKELKDEMTNLMNLYNDNCEAQRDEASDSMIKGADNQYNLLSQKTTELLEKFTQKCQSHLDTLKKNSIAFLKECDKQNKELIKRIPESKAKISWKDILIMGIGVITFLGTIYNVFT